MHARPQHVRRDFAISWASVYDLPISRRPPSSRWWAALLCVSTRRDSTRFWPTDFERRSRNEVAIVFDEKWAAPFVAAVKVEGRYCLPVWACAVVLASIFPAPNSKLFPPAPNSKSCPPKTLYKNIDAKPFLLSRLFRPSSNFRQLAVLFARQEAHLPGRLLRLAQSSQSALPRCPARLAGWQMAVLLERLLGLVGGNGWT